MADADGPQPNSDLPLEGIEEEQSADAGEPGAPDDAGQDEDDLLDDQADAAEDFLNGLLDVLDMDGEAAAEIEGSTIEVELEGPDLGVLIGRHGATLEALQELVRASVQHQTSARASLTLDIGGYRVRQREILQRKAREVAERVRSGGTAISMEPMSAFERKVVHTALAEHPGVTTSSEGEEPDRRIVVHPA